MTKKTVPSSKIKFFQENILKWFKLSGRNFSWRENGLSIYEYIIAEVLLQRTKAETITKFYPLFIAEFPSWQSLAITKVKKLEKFLKPVGLYRQRAKRLLNLANQMVKMKGLLPTDRKKLEEIPFMGQYTANAVELVIFSKSTPLLDVNMSRVLERFFGPRKMADIRYDPYLQKLSLKIVNHQNAKEINWAVLDFAALICTARSPHCISCIFKSQCNYFKHNA